MYDTLKRSMEVNTEASSKKQATMSAESQNRIQTKLNQISSDFFARKREGPQAQMMIGVPTGNSFLQTSNRLIPMSTKKVKGSVGNKSNTRKTETIVYKDTRDLAPKGEATTAWIR